MPIPDRNRIKSTQREIIARLNRKKDARTECPDCHMEMMDRGVYLQCVYCNRVEEK